MVKLARFRSKVKDDAAEMYVGDGAHANKSRKLSMTKFWTRKGKKDIDEGEENRSIASLGSDSTYYGLDPSDHNTRENIDELRERASESYDDTVEHANRGFAGAMKNRLYDSNGSAQDTANIAVVYRDFGDAASSVMNLVLRNEEEPPMPNNPTDVVVKVEASTVSLQDCIIRRGMWYEGVDLPQTPGFDAVGVIYKIGDTVYDEGIFKVGDRVAALVRTGGNQRYVNIPSSSLVKVPTEVGSVKAAAVVSTYMTAFQALDVGRGGSRENPAELLRGKNVLVTGGSGTVGRAVIQLARWAGANGVYATAYKSDHGDIQALGAVPLPFDHEKWLPKVKGHMDIVIDGVCMDGLKSPKAALNDNGRLVCIGMTSLLYSSKPGILGMPASARWASVKANCFMSNTTTFDLWQSFQSEPELFKSDLTFLLGLVKSRAIKPFVAKTIPLSEVIEAQENMETGKAIGQIVCKPQKSFVYRSKNDHDTGMLSE